MLDSSMFGSLMKGAATVATPEQTPWVRIPGILVREKKRSSQESPF